MNVQLHRALAWDFSYLQPPALSSPTNLYDFITQQVKLNQVLWKENASMPRKKEFVPKSLAGQCSRCRQPNGILFQAKSSNSRGNQHNSEVALITKSRFLARRWRILDPAATSPLHSPETRKKGKCSDVVKYNWAWVIEQILLKKMIWYLPVGVQK